MVIRFFSAQPGGGARATLRRFSGNFFAFVLLFSGFAFASGVGDLSGSSVSVISSIKGALIELGKSLIPVFVIAGAGVFTIKSLVRRGLSSIADRRMKKMGYERYMPYTVNYFGNHYRKVPGYKSVGNVPGKSSGWETTSDGFQYKSLGPKENGGR